MVTLALILTVPCQTVSLNARDCGLFTSVTGSFHRGGQRTATKWSLEKGRSDGELKSLLAWRLESSEIRKITPISQGL